MNMGMMYEDGDVWKKRLAQSDLGVSFSQNIINRILLVAASAPIFFGLGLLLYFVHPSETPLVLHYNVYFGVDLLGIWWQVYILPLLGMILFGGHFLLARHFYIKMERIACYLMLLSSGMLSCGVLIASVSIALINY